jgi:NAD(P)-dependent dehydrogenase (short-subunit alcohol dehydrogenase family)
VAVVTGATSGIGRWIGRGLARAGMDLVLVVRDVARGEAARAWIMAAAPGAAVRVERTDLSLLAEARAAGERIAAAHPAVHVLVNNAGLFSPRRWETAEGHELTLAVNHLAPFVLTRTLLPALQAGAPARVVNIGSAASDRAAIDPDDLELRRRGYGGMRAYGQSKLALMMATFAWAERLQGAGVTVNVVHPGVVATRIAQVGGIAGLAWRLGKPFMLRPEQGAETPLHVALAPELAGTTGRYFKRRAQAVPNPLAQDAALVGRAWKATEALAELNGAA